MKRLVIFVVSACSISTLAATGQEVPASANATVTLATAAPLFLLPDANRTPLVIAKEGSVLKLLGTEGQWCHIEFNDPQFGRRTGYVQNKYIRVPAPLTQPVDVSVSTVASETENIGKSSSKSVVPFILRDATPIRMRINRTLSSADAKVNETVDFEVLEDILVDDFVVIKRGATAIATVTEAQEKRRMGRAGKLGVNIDYVRLANEEKAALRAVKDVQGGGKTGAMTGAIVATSIVFFPAAPLFLFMHGKDITIPKGTEITAYINGDITLNRAKFVMR